MLRHYQWIILSLLISLGSCNKKGCTDQSALNYSSKARVDNGTCRYSSDSNVFTDDRDGRQYTLVQLGTSTWIKENIQFNVAESVLPDTVEEDNKGRLYLFSMAKEACPSGFHLATSLDWEALLTDTASKAISSVTKSTLISDIYPGVYIGFSNQYVFNGEIAKYYAQISDSSYYDISIYRDSLNLIYSQSLEEDFLYNSVKCVKD